MSNNGSSVYILTNKNLTTLYTGSTVDIARRYGEHLNHFYPNSFSARYKLYRLVFVMHFDEIWDARRVEYYIKGKKREWKVRLIEKGNPFWRNLWPILPSEGIEDYFANYEDVNLIRF